MKIKEITYEGIFFDNENKIFCSHAQECCEDNFADFEYLQDESGIFNFDFPEDLLFEECDDGFRFGSKERMYFVPCYSIQNGYYSSDVNIYYQKDKKVKRIFSILCESTEFDPRFIDYNIELYGTDFVPMTIINRINELLNFDIFNIARGYVPGKGDECNIKELIPYYVIEVSTYRDNKISQEWDKNYNKILTTISQENHDLYINLKINHNANGTHLKLIFINGEMIEI